MSLPYHVGLYALVQHHGTYLLVRQAHSTLPPGRYGLPGSALVGELGSEVAELHLRRTLLSQLGLSVGALTLCGSHTMRLGDGVQLNLIFGTEYNSGVPNPQQDVILDMEWCGFEQLQQRHDAPDWLLTTVRNDQNRTTLPGSPRAPGRPLLRWGR